MQQPAELLTQFAVILAFLSVVGYLLPAGLFHWLYLSSSKHEGDRIQARRARPKDIRREVRDSAISLVLFSLYAVGLWQLVEAGYSAVYYDLTAYPLWWLPASVLAAAILHDTYFYWSHRLMHLPLFYRHFHAGHHRSVTPTPWAMLCFQPLETVPQFIFFALLVLYVPMHPAALLVYFVLDSLFNAAGHCGYEVVPRTLGRAGPTQYLNAVAHHDLHHSRFNYNFSQYFNVWDRLMGTYLDREVAYENDPKAAAQAAGQTSAAPVRVP